MGDAEEAPSVLMQRLKSSTAGRGDLPSFIAPSMASSQAPGGGYRGLLPDSGKRPGIPPAHPNHVPPPSSFFQIMPSSASRSFNHTALFSLDSLPTFNSGDAPIEDRATSAIPLARTNSGSGRPPADGLPPRKAHRRSQSDIPFGFLQSSLSMPASPPIPPRAPGFLSRPPQTVKQESEWDRDRDRDRDSSEGTERGDPGGDDLFSAYMNLDSLDTLNSSEDRHDDMDSRASGTKTNGRAESSENESESSSVNESGSSAPQQHKEGNKRSAAGDPVPTASRHCRSLSMDSFMGGLNFEEELPRLPPSSAARAGQHSHSGSLDGMPNSFSFDFGNGDFSAAEVKKIMANEKLAEIALSDPKRVKRILANRQSAARSKERKMRYISELEHKVQTLQTEATTLSAQLTMLQRDSAGLTSHNSELKFRLQAMEQQAQLRDALNEALTAEVQRLKLATAELGEAHLSKSLNQQIQLNPQMFRLQQLQKHQQQQLAAHISNHQNNSASENEPDK